MERRLAAILAADVANYSLYMSADEGATYTALKSALGEIVDVNIAEYEGRIVKHTGDGFLAEFPTVLSGVECAVKIQQCMLEADYRVAGNQRFQFRIGVHLGDVIVDNEDIFGDGVNIAARLEGIAIPGSVFISSDVYRQVLNKPGFNYIDHGVKSVKNIPNPIQVYSVDRGEPGRVGETTMSAGSDSVRDTRLDELLDTVNSPIPSQPGLVVGRENELSVLTEAFVEARSGQGNAILLQGEPGIGKSCLIWKFCEQAQQAGALVAFGQCHETLGSPPFWAWLQILKTLHISANSQELSSANLLESLVTIQVEQQSTGHSTFATHPGSAQFLLFNRITKVLADFAKSRCVVIVIDDLHWADRSSLLLLTHLCEKLLELSILVVGAYRDMEISRKHPLFQTLGDINRAAKLRRVRLKGLSEEDVSSFITKTTEAEIPAKVLAALYEKTEGNPLFVSEVAGILKQSPVNTTLENLELEIPDGIQEAIGRRLNFLSEDCANLLSCASVVGRRFSIRILKKIIDEFNSVQIFQIIEEASGRGVIRVLDEAAGEFQFSHVLIRDILYGELSLAQKILLHGRVADSLVALQQGGSLQSNGEIARHYYQALQSGQGEQAVQYAVRAAEHAYKLSAYDEAASYYDLALEVLNFDSSLDQKQRAGILLQHSLCRHAAGLDVRQTLEALNHCLEVARENEQWRIFAEVACHKVYQGRTSERSSDALIDLTEALKHIEGDPGLIANVMAHRAMALRFCAYIGDAERVAYDAIQIADESGDPGARINALCMALLVLRGRPEKLSERISLGERALTIAREKHYHLNDTDALEWLILSCQESGDMKRVAEYIGQLNQSVEKYHVAKARYFATGASASLALFQGQWQRAETFIEAAFELGEGTLDGGAEGVYGAQMFLLNRELGRLPMISGALQQLLDDKTPMWAPGLLATYTDLNMLDQAVPLFDQLVANNFQQIAEDEMLLTCLVYLSETCVALNRVDAANGLYQRLLPYTGQMVSHPTAVCYGPADMYLGMLASMMNDFDESDRLFTQASQLANNAGNNMWIAHIKFRQAQVLRRHNYQGGKVIFQRLINEARDVAHGLGMVNILTKLDYIEKTQSNSKKADTDGLTHRELEILQLIAEGKSNKIIAAELNRSLATVATHVRSILNKTHTANRTEAAAYARERGGSSR